jgi:hypothetical protein
MASVDPRHPRASRPITFRGSVPVDLPAGTPYGLGPPRPIGGRLSLLRHSIADNAEQVVQEY